MTDLMPNSTHRKDVKGISLDLVPMEFKITSRIANLLNRHREQLSAKHSIQTTIDDFEEPDPQTFSTLDEIQVWCGKQLGHVYFKPSYDRNNRISKSGFQIATDWLCDVFRLRDYQAKKWIFLDYAGKLNFRIYENLDSYWKRVTGLDLQILRDGPSMDSYEFKKINSLRAEHMQQVDARNDLMDKTRQRTVEKLNVERHR